MKQKISEEIMAIFFPKLMKENNQETQQPSG